MKRTIIGAHAGCESTVPGSLENIRTALKHKADLIEVDLRLHEGNVYLSHDALDTEHLDRYLKFRDALEVLASEKAGLNCDLKDETVFYEVLKLLREYGMEERAVFTGSYKVKTEADAKYKYFLNIDCTNIKLSSGVIGEEEADLLIDYWKNCKDHAMKAFNLNYKTVPPAVMNKLCQAGVQISYWTVDEPEEIEHMLENGAYAMTTNRVAFAMPARERIQN